VVGRKGTLGQIGITLSTQLARLVVGELAGASQELRLCDCGVWITLPGIVWLLVAGNAPARWFQSHANSGLDRRRRSALTARPRRRQAYSSVGTDPIGSPNSFHWSLYSSSRYQAYQPAGFSLMLGATTQLGTARAQQRDACSSDAVAQLRSSPFQISVVCSFSPFRFVRADPISISNQFCGSVQRRLQW
jgi:hypothetical protein